jgi:hypothetical protein
LSLLTKGIVVELVGEEGVMGYLVPPRLPITEDVIEHIVQPMNAEAAARWRDDLLWMQQSGRWYYDPLRGALVMEPPLPDYPRASEEEV